MSSSELAQLSLCHSIDYDALLASMSLVKTILECDADGNIDLGSAAVDIMKELFGTFTPGTTPGLEYIYTDGLAGMWIDIDVTSPAAGGALSPANMSCFDDLYLYYFNKTCGTSSVLWNPEINACVREAIYLIKAADYAALAASTPMYIPLGFAVPFLVDPYDASPYDGFYGLAALFSIAFVRAISNANVDAVSYSHALTIISGFCELLKARIEMNRKLHKLQLTINSCDL